MNLSFSFFKHVLVLTGFMLLSLIYFYPVLQGKEINQPDISMYKGMAKQHLDFKNETGNETYWTNSAFGGMPTYQLGAKYPHNYIKKLDLTLRFLPRPADYLFLYLISFYILMLTLGVDFRSAIIGAVGFGFSTYLIIIFGAGHNAKAHAIAYMPLVLAGIFLVFQKRYFFGFVLTTISVGLELVANHFQMTYYLLFIILIIVIVFAIKSMREKQIPIFFKSSLILLMAAFLAAGMNASNLLATAEYAKESTRGQSELSINPDGSDKFKSTGLDRDYITEYSYGILESLNLFIPRFMGGGTKENIGTKSNFYKSLKSLGASPVQALEISKAAPTYWGKQPILVAPAYVGATLIFLSILGFLLVKGYRRWWLILSFILSLLLSYGKNLPLFTNFFIDYIPLYNKFRAVSSIQVILEMCIPVLAALGLSKLLKGDFQKEKTVNALKIVTISLSSVCVGLILFKNILFDFVGPYDDYNEIIIEALKKDRAELLVSDSLRSLILILILSGFLFLLIKKKINKNVFTISIVALILFDLIVIDRRYVNDDNFLNKIIVDNPYQPREVDKKIMKDKTHFRVFDNHDPTTKSSYFHNATQGYHAAKMRRYKELMDFHIYGSQGINLEVLNMLNVKYIIRDEYKMDELESANGNSWFVKSLKSVPDADSEINSLYTINSKKTAIINSNSLLSKEFELDSLSSLVLTDYNPNKLIYSSSNKYDGFAVFSENFYPHGWKVTIDGNEVQHYNVNYILRGLYIPKGNHKIVFEFVPGVIKTGSRLSLSSTLLFLALFLGNLGRIISKKFT